jgi:hypothetical protein
MLADRKNPDLIRINRWQDSSATMAAGPKTEPSG